MRRKPWIFVSSIAVACAAAGLAIPATPPSAVGHWEGAITLPTGELAVIVDLDGGAEAAWKGEADIPQQGIRNLAVVNLSVSGANVRFELPGIPGTPTFAGALAEDGSAISGSLTQSGQTLPFRLERQGAPAFGVVPDDGIKLVDRGTPGTGPSGEWHGVLESGPHKLRLILEVVAGQDGVLGGTLVSVDQGGAEIPVSNVEYTPDTGAFKFGVPVVSGSFEGKLNADGSEASGQWSQGGAGLPLVLKRAK